MKKISSADNLRKFHPEFHPLANNTYGSEYVVTPKVPNESGILPTEFKVLILPLTVEEKIGSILLPDQKRDQEQYSQMEGTLIACSPLAFTYASKDEWAAVGASPPKPGDRVLFAMYSGGRTRKGKDGKEYRIVNDKDVMAVLI